MNGLPDALMPIARCPGFGAVVLPAVNEHLPNDPSGYGAGLLRHQSSRSDMPEVDGGSKQ
jgi:hypothetical protein